MKKILFIMDTFPLGGIAKSLLGFMNELDEKYEIDFLLMKQEGMFLKLIPERVHLLDEPIEREFRNPHPKNIYKAYKNLTFKRFVKWLEYSIRCTWARVTGGLAKMVCTMDVLIAKNAQPLEKYYDAAIAYQGGRCIYYLAEQVSAKKKIGYVHNDYKQCEIDYMLKTSDEIYFPKMDVIATVSEQCGKSLIDVFPNLKEHIYVQENVSSPKMILDMAQETVDDMERNDEHTVQLVTLARFDIKIKGMDLAMDACKILCDKGYDIKWYFFGDGEQRPEVERMIEERDLQRHFFVPGAKLNPYKYIQQCDIYVQPSRVEGKPVALDEVKILNKPVVVTKFSTVYDQFTDGVTALMADMNPECIAEKIERIIKHPEVGEELSRNLSKEIVDVGEQIQHFEMLI